MAWLAFIVVLLVLSPTAGTALTEFKNKNIFGAVGISLYLGIIIALAVYQIFIR
ncbi:MAG: hypothetical protein H0Z38_07005 [Firmicutes bacterium]|nr:hypothetical protein [Bacillota bacterium]